MVVLHLVSGKKGVNDVVVLVEAYTEPLSLTELLFIIKCVLDSEPDRAKIKWSAAS